MAMSVRNGPGDNVFTRTDGPYSAASERVIANTPALAAADFWAVPAALLTLSAAFLVAPAALAAR